MKSFAFIVASLLVLSALTAVAFTAGADQGLDNNDKEEKSDKQDKSDKPDSSDKQDKSDKPDKSEKHPGDSSGIVSQDGEVKNLTKEKEQMRQMSNESARLGLFGGFNQTDSLFEGRFISFTFNESSGALANYTVVTIDGDVVLFDAIDFGDFGPENISLMGSLFVEWDSNVSVVVHDNPVALLRMASNRSIESVNLFLGQGISAVVLPKSSNEANNSFVLISGAGVQGILTANNGTLSIASDDSGNISIMANASDVMFRMAPAFVKENSALDDVVQGAVTNGKMAGEFTLTVRNGSAMYDHMQYRSGFELEVQQANQNHIRLVVSSSEPEGKVLKINLDHDTFETLVQNDIVITLDGIGIRLTHNPLDVLSASGSQAGDALYCIETTSNGSQILIYIPSFSTHVLELSSVSPMASLLSVTGLLALLGAMVAVGAATFVLLRRKS